jgi:phytoene synthase
MSDDSLRAQLQKLEARRPELGLQAIFMPSGQRQRIALWYALQDEIEEACFELSEPFIAQAKLGWWGEELARGAAGQGRHPLVQAFFDVPSTGAADQSLWRALPLAALDLVEREVAPGSVDQALSALRPLAAAFDHLERALFGGDSGESQIASELLLRRYQRAGLGHHAQARLPRNLLARHGLAPAHLSEPERPDARSAFARDFAAELRALNPAALPSLARPRALQVAVLQWQLDELARSGKCSVPRGFRLMLGLWRAARGSAAPTGE